MNEKKQSNIIEEVDRFIQHYRGLDYIVSKEAINLEVSFPKNWTKFADANYGTHNGKGVSFGNFLANSITAYEKDKNKQTAERCLLWINRGFAYGVIKTGDGVVNKLKECSKENTILNEKIEILSDALMKAKERIEELEQMMPNAGSENA